jgi:VWFA-related protein
MKSTASSFAIVFILVVSPLIARAQEQSNYSDSMPYRPRVFTLAEDAKDGKKTKKQLPRGLAPISEPGLGAEVQNHPITVPVSVLDANATPVAGLTAKDFKIFIDAVEMKVERVEQIDEPLNVVILMDSSASSAEKRTLIQHNALALIATLRPEDKALVAAFNDKLKLLTEFTSDRSALEKAILSKRTPGGTSLFDSLHELIDKKLSPLTGRNIIVLMTDGVDTTSSKWTYASSLAALERTNVMVYPIYIDTFSDAVAATNRGISLATQGPWLNASLLSSIAQPRQEKDIARDYEVGGLYLDDIVNVSGGRAVRASKVEDKRVEQPPLDLRREIAAKYFVTFTPTIKSRVNQRMHLKVRVGRPELAVFARGSYIAGN